MTTAITLDAPLELPCGATLRNRVAKAAMSEQLADRRGRPPPALVALYRRWSQSGAGLLITGNAAVNPAQLIEPYNVTITADTDPSALRPWANAGQAGSAQLWMQLNHPGRQALRSVTAHSLAPSAVPPKEHAPRMALAPPMEMTEADIHRTVEQFAAAAAKAEQSSFDGVEVHAAHGYLLSEFLSPLTNRRQDRWGGSLENRSRFLLDVVKSILTW